MTKDGGNGYEFLVASCLPLLFFFDSVYDDIVRLRFPKVVKSRSAASRIVARHGGGSPIAATRHAHRCIILPLVVEQPGLVQGYCTETIYSRLL